MYTKIDINNYVKIKLTIEGEILLSNLKTSFGSNVVDSSYILNRKDSEGYIHLKLWEFIKIFGPYMENGKSCFFDNMLLIDYMDLIENQKKHILK